MTCPDKKYVSLMNKVLDDEASEKERADLFQHMESCAACHRHYHELKRIGELLNGLPRPQLSVHFTNNVLEHLPAATRPHVLKKWMNRHPVLATAAICALPMSFVVLTVGRQTVFQGKSRDDYIVLNVPAEHS
jgi:anti-sigma factor RsiW